MKNITEILSEIGIEIPQDKKADFDKNFLDNYKTIAEFSKTSDKLTEAKQTVKTITDELEQLKATNATADDWKSKFETLQNDVAEKEKQATLKAEQEAKTKELETRFNAVTGDKKWTHDAIKKDYFNKFANAIASEENKGKGDADIFNTLTKDDAGAFVGTKADVIIKGNTGMASDIKYSADDIRHMSIDEINKHWDDVSASLKNFKK